MDIFNSCRYYLTLDQGNLQSAYILFVHFICTAQTCDVLMSLNGLTKTLVNAYTYNAALTPTVSGVTPSRGGTGGGTTITISGSGFGYEMKFSA